jgi:hypothetical protein
MTSVHPPPIDGMVRSESSMEKRRLLVHFLALSRAGAFASSGVGVKAGERVRVVVRTVDDDTQ